MERIFLFAWTRSDGDRVGANVVGGVPDQRDRKSISRTSNQLGLEMEIYPLLVGHSHIGKMTSLKKSARDLDLVSCPTLCRCWSCSPVDP